MARLLAETFPTDAAGRALLQKVQIALFHLTGSHGVKGDYRHPPKRLDPGAHTLQTSYRSTWLRCTIEFSGQERGASIRKDREIRVGPFFLKPHFKALDLEKVILHEYLHAALDISFRDAHHGMIDQIIQFDLKYPGAPNPAEGRI